jgi:hypothetical protein
MKGQSAIEYLMKYGYVLLFVAIILTVLLTHNKDDFNQLDNITEEISQNANISVQNLGVIGRNKSYIFIAQCRPDVQPSNITAENADDPRIQDKCNIFKTSKEHSGRIFTLQ